VSPRLISAAFVLGLALGVYAWVIDFGMICPHPGAPSRTGLIGDLAPESTWRSASRFEAVLVDRGGRTSTAGRI